jgi:hypothetical protein
MTNVVCRRGYSIEQLLFDEAIAWLWIKLDEVEVEKLQMQGQTVQRSKENWKMGHWGFQDSADRNWQYEYLTEVVIVKPRGAAVPYG